MKPNNIPSIYIVTFDDGEYGYGLIQDLSRAFPSYDEAMVYLTSLVGKRPYGYRLSSLDMFIKEVQLG